MPQASAYRCEPSLLGHRPADELRDVTRGRAVCYAATPRWSRSAPALHEPFSPLALTQRAMTGATDHDTAALPGFPVKETPNPAQRQGSTTWATTAYNDVRSARKVVVP